MSCRVQRRLAVLLDDAIADMKKFIQSITIRLFQSQYEKPASFLEVRDPVKGREVDIKTDKLVM
jgi:hypothetical protein